MVAFPFLFSFPFALPSLPSISLPANIQRRFLSYVLKRALGRFVKTGGLDVERIQAQISEGWVEIQGLEVDTEVRFSLASAAPEGTAEPSGYQCASTTVTSLDAYKRPTRSYLRQSPIRQSMVRPALRHSDRSYTGL